MTEPLDPNRMARVCTPGAQLDEPAFVDLLQSYAQAMWSWSRAENKLFVLFALCIGKKAPNVPELRATFHSVISPAGRMDMLHAAATVAWKKTRVWNVWVSLYTECKTQLALRGRIAHLVGYCYYPKGLNGKSHALLTEPSWRPKAPITYGEAKNVGFDAIQLSDCAQQWEMLNNRLGIFVVLVQEVMKPQPSDSLVTRLLHLLGSPNVLTHAKSPRPPSPSRKKP